MEPSAGLNATPTWWSLTVRWLTDFQTPKQMLPPTGGRKAFSNSVPSSCQVLKDSKIAEPSAAVYLTCHKPMMVAGWLPLFWLSSQDSLGPAPARFGSPQPALAAGIDTSRTNAAAAKIAQRRRMILPK